MEKLDADVDGSQEQAPLGNVLRAMENLKVCDVERKAYSGNLPRQIDGRKTPAKRPTRRKKAATKKRQYSDDDDDEENDMVVCDENAY